MISITAAAAVTLVVRAAPVEKEPPSNAGRDGSFRRDE